MSIYKKLIEAQKEIMANPVKKESKNPFFNSNYADIAQLLMVVVPILNKHGLVLTQPTVYENDKMFIETVLNDGDGGTSCISGKTLITPAKNNDPQSVGSAITYARRYGLQSLLSLPTIDDDGNSASQPQKAPTPKKTPTKAKYVMPFGKQKGKHFDDIEASDLHSALEWMISKNDDNKFDGLIAEIKEYLDK